MAASASPHASVARWRMAVATSFALGGLLIATWGPRLPTIKAQLGLDDGALGLLVVGATVSSIVGLVCSSALHTRLGGRRGIAAMMSIAAAGVAIIAVASGPLRSPPLVELGFVALGFGIGVVDVMINVEGAAVEQAGGKVVMPLLHACWSAGAVVGSGIGAGAAALGIAPTWQFLAEAALALGAILLASRAIPHHAVAAPPAGSVAERVRGWLRAWRDRRLLAIGLLMLGCELGEGSANNWLTLGVSQGHHQRDAAAALFFTAFAASETGFRAVSGPIVQRLGRSMTVRLTTAGGVVGIALFILARSPGLVLAGAVLWAIGVSMGFPLGMSAAAEGGSGSAARVSVVASVGYLAGLGGPPVVGFLSEGVGLLGALWLLAAFLVVALLTAGALAPRAARPTEPPSGAAPAAVQPFRPVAAPTR